MKRYIRAAKDLLHIAECNEIIAQASSIMKSLGAECYFENNSFLDNEGKVIGNVTSLRGYPNFFTSKGDIDYKGLDVSIFPMIFDFYVDKKPYVSTYSHKTIETCVKEHINKVKRIADSVLNLQESVQKLQDNLNNFCDYFENKYINEFEGVQLDAEVQIPEHVVNTTADSDLTVRIRFKSTDPRLYFEETFDYFGSRFSSDKFNELEDKLLKYIRVQSLDFKTDKLTTKFIKKLLNKYNIDTTQHSYQLEAETYDRYESGKRYTKTFKCAGDYLAYFSMLFHKSPTPYTLDNYFGVDGFIETVQDYPSVDAIYDHASSSWYGDGDDYIISLVNLDTNEVLYEG